MRNILCFLSIASFITLTSCQKELKTASEISGRYTLKSLSQYVIKKADCNSSENAYGFTLYQDDIYFEFTDELIDEELGTFKMTTNFNGAYPNWNNSQTQTSPFISKSEREYMYYLTKDYLSNQAICVSDDSFIQLVLPIKKIKGNKIIFELVAPRLNDKCLTDSIYYELVKE